MARLSAASVAFLAFKIIYNTHFDIFRRPVLQLFPSIKI